MRSLCWETTSNNLILFRSFFLYNSDIASWYMTKLWTFFVNGVALFIEDHDFYTLMLICGRYFRFKLWRKSFKKLILSLMAQPRLLLSEFSTLLTRRIFIFELFLRENHLSHHKVCIMFYEVFCDSNWRRSNLFFIGYFTVLSQDWPLKRRQPHSFINLILINSTRSLPVAKV